MKRVFRPGRYANVTATIALVVALGGTSYAAITLPKNSVGSRQIKSKAVGKSELKSNAVRSKKVKNDSLTGADVNESKLGPVPNALTLQGKGPDAFESSARTIHVVANVAIGSTKTVAQVGPFTVLFTCDAFSPPAGQAAFLIKTSENDAVASGDPDFDVGDTDFGGAVSASGFAVNVLPGVVQDAAGAPTPLNASQCVGSATIFSDGK